MLELVRCRCILVDDSSVAARSSTHRHHEEPEPLTLYYYREHNNEEYGPAPLEELNWAEFGVSGAGQVCNLDPFHNGNTFAEDALIPAHTQDCRKGEWESPWTESKAHIVEALVCVLNLVTMTLLRACELASSQLQALMHLLLQALGCLIVLLGCLLVVLLFSRDSIVTATTSPTQILLAAPSERQPQAAVIHDSFWDGPVNTCNQSTPRVYQSLSSGGHDLSTMLTFPYPDDGATH